MTSHSTSPAITLFFNKLGQKTKPRTKKLTSRGLNKTEEGSVMPERNTAFVARSLRHGCSRSSSSRTKT
ncbi:hypothetical protein KFK09_025995 [Dendrobium nobile]|uniref:Uncharacterized protein n=1 Tax=Dendrobium nobile TaxID=94219 RepID=A0A8T3ABL9_DENNO|nr:hypothetical protein KFK09_025995 [Dendrobium nobile]